MNKIKNAVYGTMASAMALAPALASAQGWNPVNGTVGSNLANRTVGSMLNLVLLYLLALVGVLGIIGFVVAGVFYLTAAGDEDQVGKAKSIMMYSIIGVIVALVGYIVVNAIGTLFVGGNANF
ncbi:MAG: hypothetical protein KBD27_02770 [Candidatus Moranbacteria bacterium]|nr:hypothetical protein [Candidatus Moranbacteria bacterium]